MRFRILTRSKKSAARTGIVHTPHGSFRTPAFMPIATRGAVKGLLPEDVRALGAEIILGNTYHLWLRPGLAVLKRFAGLHRFIGWTGPILTDSGGFQVFSLSKHRKITETGVTFRDPHDGVSRLLTPEISIRIQRDFGSDIIMALDECTPYPATRRYATESMKMTTRWAKRCLAVKRKKGQALFGIIQGSTFHDLRKAHARDMSALPFDGFAIGGDSVGEPEAVIHRIITVTAPLLPVNKPRYVMGIGKPHQLVYAVRQGIDMFDCVLPTRNARHGTLFVWKEDPKSAVREAFTRAQEGAADFRIAEALYEKIQITNERFTQDLSPIDQWNDTPTSQTYSRAYLRHLFKSGEMLGMRLATLQNLRFYLRMMEELREIIGT